LNNPSIVVAHFGSSFFFQAVSFMVSALKVKKFNNESLFYTTGLKLVDWSSH
jgi:hypothetical protein